MIDGLLRLMRLENGLIAFAAVMVGALISDGDLTKSVIIFMAGLSALLIAAGGNVHNDVCDVDIDRLNRPKRPIPAEIVPISKASLFAIGLFSGGLTLAFFIPPPGLWVAGTVIILLIFYNLKWKRLPLIGNFVVAFNSALCFVYGGIAVDNLMPTLIPAAFAFLFHFAREMIKDLEDMPGDAAAGATTFPIRFGKLAAIRVIISILLISMIVILLPYFFHIYSLIYLIIILIAIETTLAGSIFLLLRKPSVSNFSHISRILKIDMIIGILAIYFGC